MRLAASSRPISPFCLALPTNFRIADILTLMVEGERCSIVARYSIRSARERGRFAQKANKSLDARLAEVLLQWRPATVFPRDEDWLFANPVTGRPYHQESLQKSQIKRAAKLAGLGEDIGWHTFRHSYRSWLDETGAPMKVQQELMRHASIQTTMNVYGRAMTETKRRANSQVVGLVFGPNSQDLPADAATATLQ